MVEHGGGAVLDRVLAFFEGSGEVVVLHSWARGISPAIRLRRADAGRRPGGPLVDAVVEHRGDVCASCSDRAAISCGARR